MLRKFKTPLLLLALSSGTLLGLTHAAWAERKFINMLLLRREVVENMLWEENQFQMGKTSVQGCFQGLGASADSVVVVTLEGKYDLFEAYIGYLKSASPGRSCVFEVSCDGTTLYTSDSVTSGKEPEKIKVDVKGRQSLTLRIRPDSYGATTGAAFGTPMLYADVPPDEMTPMLTVDYNGEKLKVEQPGGKPPKELTLPIPLKTGEYRVKVTFDKDKNHAVITSEPVTP
jgi:hypothetical protein